ncbi:MAG: MFS transporter [Clostridia bacterium]|nr:MFS transporter [Clostridia bacterium]
MLFILIVIYIVFISLGLPDSLFGVAWPVVHTEFGISEGFASVYSIIIGVCTGGVSFVSGKLIRKFGTSRVTLVSILITALGLAAISLAPNIAVMMISSVIMGYGAGAIDTGLNNFVSLHYKAHHMNWLHCFWGVGVTVSPLIMSLFLGDGGTEWRKGYRVVALLQLLIAALVCFSLKKWGAIEKTEKEQTSADEGSAGLLDIMKIRGVLTGILSLGAYCSMEFLLGTWGASYAVNVFAVSPDVAAKWVSLYYGGIMVGRVVSGFLSMKFNDKSLIRGGIAVSLIGIIIFALPLGTASLFGFFLIGMGFGPVFPSVLHSVPERFGAKYSADITGYHMGGAYAIGFGVQLIYGFVATRVSFGITPFVLMALCAALIIFNEATVKRTKT